MQLSRHVQILSIVKFIWTVECKAVIIDADTVLLKYHDPRAVVYEYAIAYGVKL